MPYLNLSKSSKFIEFTLPAHLSHEFTAPIETNVIVIHEMYKKEEYILLPTQPVSCIFPITIISTNLSLFVPKCVVTLFTFAVQSDNPTIYFSTNTVNWSILGHIMRYIEQYMDDTNGCYTLSTYTSEKFATICTGNFALYPHDTMILTRGCLALSVTG